jgi:radical SAM superfamily enzyme YgiQ (UPF0313 family)
MNVLLINPDHNINNNFPWGVLSIGSYLNQQNKNVKILDLSNYAQDQTEKIEEDTNWADLVGIGMFSSDIPAIKEIIDSIKSKDPSMPIICGGPHVVLDPESTCEYCNIDFVCYGEGERTLDLLIDELEKHESNFSNVPGLIYKHNNQIIKTVPSHPVGIYDIDYELLHEDVQKSFNDYIQVLTGRGCSYRCTFCYNPVINQKFRPRAAGKIINEIDKVVKKYNPKIIYFRDENFFQEKDRILDFIELYKERNYSFKWRATCRVSYFRDNYINDELLLKLEEVNCQALKFGLESGSQRVLNYMKKGIKVSWSKNAINKIAKSKIGGSYSFLIGLPTETYHEYIETLNLMKYIVDHDRNLDSLIGPQYFRLYPGGELYNDVTSNYQFIKKPESFEEYSQAFINDQLGIYTEMDYPWIPKKGQYTAKHSNYLIRLYRMNTQDILHYKRLLLVPLILFLFRYVARVRFKLGFFSYLYEFYLFSKLHKISHNILGLDYFVANRHKWIRWWSKLPYRAQRAQEIEK